MNKKIIFCAIFVFTAFLSASFASQTFAQQLVINEVYGGGGNTTPPATYNADFIELYCAGPASCDLNGLSVQYANATNGFGGFTGNAIVLNNTTIAAGSYYLIQVGSAKTTGSSITPNQTTAGGLATDNGNIILVNQTTALGNTCPADGTAVVLDKVAYGTGTCREGTASAPTGSNTTSVQRSPNGADSNNNAADFRAAAPSPGSAGPTTASATVAGRIIMKGGKGVSRAQLILTDGAGNSRVVMSNMFGYYRFAEVPTGETYILNLRSKGFNFIEQTRVITVTEDLNDVDFVGF